MRAQRSFVSGLNYYVPAMQAGADLGQELDNRFSFGAPILAPAATNDIISTGFAVNGAVSVTLISQLVKTMLDGPWGRTVGFKASGATGANVVFTVYGRDYLGQAMRETITVANGDGTTSIYGLKAFKWIDKVVHNGGASNAVTALMGSGPRLGLPYVTVAVEREYSNNVVAAAGTLTAPVFTDPQTASTGDPRGTYIPTTTLDGAKVIEIDAQISSYVNANNRGGLHGIAHFNG